MFRSNRWVVADQNPSTDTDHRVMIKGNGPLPPRPTGADYSPDRTSLHLTKPSTLSKGTRPILPALAATAKVNLAKGILGALLGTERFPLRPRSAVAHREGTVPSNPRDAPFSLLLSGSQAWA